MVPMKLNSSMITGKNQVAKPRTIPASTIKVMVAFKVAFRCGPTFGILPNRAISGLPRTLIYKAITP